MRGSFGGLRCCVDVLPQVREGKLEEGGREEVGELQEVEHGAQAAELGVDPVADILTGRLPLVVGRLSASGGEQAADARRPGAWEWFEVSLAPALVGAAEGHPFEPGDASPGHLPGLVGTVSLRGVGRLFTRVARVAAASGRRRIVVEQPEGAGGEVLVSPQDLGGVEDRGVEQDVVVEC